MGGQRSFHLLVDHYLRPSPKTDIENPTKWFDSYEDIIHWNVNTRYRKYGDMVYE